LFVTTVSARFWLGLQNDFGLEEELTLKRKELYGIERAGRDAA